MITGGEDNATIDIKVDNNLLEHFKKLLLQVIIQNAVNKISEISQLELSFCELSETSYGIYSKGLTLSAL